MGKLIWILDDSPTVCKIIETALHHQGYEIQSFLNGEAAIRWLSSPGVCIPDLIFVDLGLPQMDGYSVIRHLRAQPAFSQTPLVILSRRNGFIDKLKGKLAGADGYVEKPFTVAQLISIVRNQSGTPELANILGDDKKDSVPIYPPVMK